MKTIEGWWFCKERKLPHRDGRKIKLGITHKISGEIVPCRRGLHLSRNILDALKYAPGSIVYKVRGSGKIIPHGNPVDKYCCSERKYLSGGLDCKIVLRKFARLCALDVIHLWDAPDIVVKYLKTGDKNIRAAAMDAARNAARNAAWNVAWDAAGAAAWAAARNAAWAAAGDAAKKKQSIRLSKMIRYHLEKEVTNGLGSD